MAQLTAPIVAISITALQQGQASIQVDTTSLEVGDIVSYERVDFSSGGPSGPIELDGPDVYVTKKQDWELIPLRGPSSRDVYTVYKYDCYSIAMNGKTGQPASNAPKGAMPPILIRYT